MPNDCAGFELGADFGHLHENDVAEFVLRVIGDADGADVALNFDPFMLLSCSDNPAGYMAPLSFGCARAIAALVKGAATMRAAAA